MSAHFNQSYPNLEAYIHERGKDNLKLCSLGPGNSYYARWRDGRWVSWASDEIIDAISDAHSDGRYVKAIALGYGKSYVISLGLRSRTTKWSKLGIRYNLKGYYKGLKKSWTKTIERRVLLYVATPPS
jgi:hypothetical protein